MTGSEVAVPAPVRMVTQYESTLADILPAHISTATFVRLCHGVLRKNPAVLAAANANPQSFLSAVMESARLGHEPGTDHFALTVRGKGPGAQVVGIEQYQGVIDRMYRAGAVTAVRANVIREHDEWVWDGQGIPAHRANWLASEAERGMLTGVYAYATLDTGQHSRVVVMGRDEVMRHRAAAATKNVWDTWEASMWLKTAVHELEKWVPTTAEYRRAVAATQAVLAAAGVPEPVPAVMYQATVETPEGGSQGADGPVVVDASAGDEWPPVARPGGGGSDGE